MSVCGLTTCDLCVCLSCALPCPHCSLCTVMVRESLCYSVLGSRVAVSYPSRLQISQNSSLSDLDVLHQYERAITDKMQFYRENGVQVEDQDCQETVLVATCLELYPVCSASPSRSSCSLSCDKWKLHVGSTCACSGAEDCPSLLQQVADVCPFSEGRTLFTSSGVQCQRLSVGKCEGAHMHTHIHVPVHACTVCVIKKLTHARIYDKHCMHNGLCVHAQNMWLDKCLCLWFVSLCADLHRRITSGSVSREAQ